MTDREVMIMMLIKAGITYKIEYNSDKTAMISIEAGYVGFVSCITFKPDGGLKSIEAYE